MSLMPNYLLREWTNDGKLASGGFLYFYNSLTLTPKTVYSDATLTTPLTNPVQLDASGSAVIFMGPGAYRIWLKDKDGAQIAPWVDGVIGDGNSGSGINSNATFSTVKIYQDLRDLTVPTDFVYVAGRTMVGDGGAGIFQRIPTPTTDDDGIILNQASGSISYKRVFDSFIDPQWFGVKYLTVIDNTSLWDRVTAASVLYNCSIVVTGGIYINQNITIPSYSNIIFNDDGYFYSTLATTITFAQGSNMTSEGIAFGLNVSPKFNLNTVDSIKLSWMGGTVVEDQFQKFLSSPLDSRIEMVVDKIITLSISSISILNPISFINGSYITLTGTTIDVSMKRIVCDKETVFQFPNMTTGTFYFGNKFIKPEIFGATGVISYNAWREVYCALMTGKCYLTTGQSYSVQTSLPSLPSTVEIDGGGTLQLTNGVTLNTSNLTIRDISITTPTAVSWASVTYLELFNCVIPSLYTAGTQITDGVTYSDKTTNPSYNGSPSLYNAYLPLLPNSRALETDSTGKIVSGASFKYDLNNWRRVGYYPHYEASSVIGFSIEYPSSGYIWALSSRTRGDRSATTFNRPVGDVNGFWTERLIPVPNQLVGATAWYCQGFKALGSLYIMFVKSNAGSNYLLTIWASYTPFDTNSWTLKYQGSQVANSAITWDFDCIVRNGNTLYASAGSYSPGVVYKVANDGTVTTKSGASPNLMNIIGYDYENHKILATASISSVSNFGISSDEGLTWTWYPISDANLYGAVHCTGTIYTIGGFKPSWSIPGYWMIDTTVGTPYFIDVYINQSTPSNIGSMRAVKDSVIAVAPGNPNIILAGPRNGNGLSQKYSPYTTGYMGCIEYNDYYEEVLLGGSNNMILSGI